MRSLIGPMAAAACLAHATAAFAQGEPMRLEGLTPAGARDTVSESAAALQFTLANPGPADREARILVFYTGQADTQYGRDVWVPGGAMLASWLPVGPAPAGPSATRRDVQFQLFDRTGGELRPLPPPGDDRLRSRAVPYRRREPTTAVLVDSDDDPEALTLARAFREARILSESVAIVRDRFLPPTPESLDGVDHLILAGDRLAADPVGARAVRQWVSRGGALWVLLDRTDPDTLAPILGEDPGFQVVSRTSLTTVRLGPPGGEPDVVRSFDQPVDLVRVLPTDSMAVLFEANGWPAALARPFGRGRVVVTTLGGPAWHRPRGARDNRSPFANFPELPLPLPTLERLAMELVPEPQPGGFRSDDFRPLLAAEIGYAVPGRTTAGLVLGGFTLALGGVGAWLRRARHPGAVVWLAPAAATVAAGLFAALGAMSRSAVPPTAGAAAVLAVAPGTGEADAAGLFAVYRPASGPAALTAEHGGDVELDAAGLDGQTRRRMQTDLDAWHWENITLPAGVRAGPYRTVVRTGPVAAVARFGPDGVEGRLTTAAFSNPSDAILLTPARERVAVRTAADGSFAADSDDVLPAGQYLGESTVLTDQQQRRRDVYQKLLARPLPTYLDGRDLLLAWADPPGLPFASEPGERTVGSALLVVPVEYERPAAGTRVTVPRGFAPFRAVFEGNSIPPTLESIRPIGSQLRFQLPRSVLPLAVERATLFLTIRAPSRRVTLGGFADNQLVTVLETESPIDPIRVDITDAKLLRLDAAGGLHVGLAVSDRIDRAGRPENIREVELDAKWCIESLSLEVVGRVGER